MSEPRGVEARLKWMVDNEPGVAGQCANWTWQACGGDNGNPPRWGCEDANEVVERTRDAGDLYTSGTPPRGAIVLYTSSTHGHMCLAKGDGDVMSTDPYGNWGATGTMPQDWPVENWGQTYAGWSQRYNGTLLPMTEPGKVYVEYLVQGSSDSDSVRRLQDVLNHTSLPAPGNVFLPVLGNYGEDTQTVVQVWQTEHGFSKGAITNEQADILFAGTGHTVIHATEVEPEPPDPEPEPPQPSSATGYGSDDWYSGKQTGPVSIKPGSGWTDLPRLEQSPSGITEGNPHDHHFAYFRVELTEASTAKRLFEVRWVRSNGDETAYDHRLFDPSVKKSYGFGTYHTERGSGLGGRWQAKVTGGSDPVTVTTNYAKTEIEWQDAQETAARVMQATFGVTPAVARAVVGLILAALLVLAVLVGTG